jgi:hypothetical protein
LRIARFFTPAAFSVQYTRAALPKSDELAPSYTTTTGVSAPMPSDCTSSVSFSPGGSAPGLAAGPRQRE